MHIAKNMHGGWRAETRIDRGDTSLSVVTMKRHDGGISTTAKLERVEGSFYVWGYNDPVQRIEHGKVKATEKKIAELHQQALKEITL